MKQTWDRDEAAWEARLAAAWKASEGPDEGGEGESAALARRLDGILRAERAARRARRVRAWLAGAAAAACAALAALPAWRGGRGAVAGAEVAAAEAAEEDEPDVAEAREAPVSAAFGELEEVLTELAALDFRYGWDDEDLEMAN